MLSRGYWYGVNISKGLIWILASVVQVCGYLHLSVVSRVLYLSLPYNCAFAQGFASQGFGSLPYARQLVTDKGRCSRL